MWSSLWERNGCSFLWWLNLSVRGCLSMRYKSTKLMTRKIFHRIFIFHLANTPLWEISLSVRATQDSCYIEWNIEERLHFVLLHSMIRYYGVKKKNPMIVMRPLAIIIHKWKMPIFHFICLTRCSFQEKGKEPHLGKMLQEPSGWGHGCKHSALQALYSSFRNHFRFRIHAHSRNQWLFLSAVCITSFLKGQVSVQYGGKGLWSMRYS